MQLVATADNPIPPGAQVGALSARDGLQLRYALWQPSDRGLKGTVCLFGGRSEFIEKYFEVIGELRRRGFAVATMDWRGQGGSGRMLRNPRKGHIDSFEQYDDDLAAFMQEIVLPDSPAPYFALAHSMGGNILLRCALSRTVWFDRIVTTAPMLHLVLPISQGTLHGMAECLSMLGLGSAYLPGGGDTAVDTIPFKNNVRTSDPRRHARAADIVAAAPHLGLGGPTVQWVNAACDSMALLASPDFPQRVTVPVMMFGASHDRVASTPEIERLAAQMRVGAFLLVPGARHEIMMERDEIRAQFWAAFDAFIPGTPAPGMTRVDTV